MQGTTMSNHLFKVGMEIEYDDVKNDINYKKHKYELACAQDIINSITLFGSERAIFSDDYDEEELRLMRIKFISDVAN